MRFVAFIVVAALAACAPQTPAPAVTPPGEMPEALAAAAAAYEEAQIAGDAATLERLIAEDYVLVGSDGERESKSQLIAFWTADGFDPSPVTVADPVEIIFTDGAALGGTVTLAGTQGEEPFSVTIRYVDVWQLRDGQWRVVYGQATRVPGAQ
jgi:hypothetical protein